MSNQKDTPVSRSSIATEARTQDLSLSSALSTTLPGPMCTVDIQKYTYIIITEASTFYINFIIFTL